MCLLIRSVRFISWGGGSALILLLTSPIEADAQIMGGRIGVTLLDNMRGMPAATKQFGIGSEARSILEICRSA
jgi:hypothetical protein